jgi:hypothetical protein
MSLLSDWFGPKYDDQRLVTLAEKAIIADPLVREPGDIVINSKKGQITLDGIVHRPEERDRIEGVVRTALTATGIKHEAINNNLHVVTSAGSTQLPR